MHSVSRPAEPPPELVNLANSGRADFGPLASPLDAVFAGVCAYCERGIRDDDADLSTRFFTCDHFLPRHLVCHHEVGQCAGNPPPHSNSCPIYDWGNLMYACHSCADTKGGQWPRPGESADGYINPTGNPHSDDSPEAVFTYDIGAGAIMVHGSVIGTARNNAQRTIDDLALNTPRGPRNPGTRYAARDRRINLAERRSQWVKRFRESLDSLPALEPAILRSVIDAFIHPSGRFSSICRQYIQESEYREHFTPPSQSAAQS